MKNKIYFIILLALIAGAVIIGMAIHAKGPFWIWSIAAIVLYIWCKKEFSGTPWFGKNRPAPAGRPGISEETYQLQVSQYPVVPGNEREAYKTLTRLCIAPAQQEKLFTFFDQLKNFAADEDYGTTLNYVMDYLDDQKIHFIMALDWKAAVEDLEWRIGGALQDNFGISISLPQQADYGPRASISYHHVFTDFDRPLRAIGFQIGLINTGSDEYVVLVHKIADKEQVALAVGQVGYPYEELVSDQ